MEKRTNKKEKSKVVGILFFCAVLIVTALSVFNIALFSSSNQKGVLGLKTVLNSNQVLLQERLFWEAFLINNPTYFSGWIELVKIEVQLENIESAKNALQKARFINPNSDEIKKLGKLLGL